eukprot:6707648-Prymnesium_polylepis.2
MERRRSSVSQMAVSLFRTKGNEKRVQEQIFDTSLSNDDVDALLVKLRAAEKQLPYQDVQNELTLGMLMRRRPGAATKKRKFAPDGNFIFCWKLFTIVPSVTACILTPVELAFPGSLKNAELWYALDIVLDAIFLKVSQRDQD